MNNSSHERIDRKPIFVFVWLAVIVLAISFLLTLTVPSSLLKVVLAIFAFTVALSWPIHQKHISLFSILLFISGILFLVSGAVEHAYDSVVRPLSVLSQMEFSKILRPQQISRGLWNVGIGSAYLCLSVAGLRSNKISKRMKWGFFIYVRLCSFLHRIRSIFDYKWTKQIASELANIILPFSPIPYTLPRSVLQFSPMRNPEHIQRHVHSLSHEALYRLTAMRFCRTTLQVPDRGW